MRPIKKLEVYRGPTDPDCLVRIDEDVYKFSRDGTKDSWVGQWHLFEPYCGSHIKLSRIPAFILAGLLSRELLFAK